MPAQAVIFDLDDTIIVEESFARASMRAAVAAVAPNGGLPDRDPGLDAVLLEGIRRIWRSGPYIDLCTQLGIASWEGLWATCDGGHRVLDGLRQWLPTYRVQAWRAALGDLGIDDPGAADVVADAYIETQRRGHPLIPGAAEAVRAFADEVPLGLLTNGPPDIQRFKLDRTGLTDCFTMVGISGELAVGKPSAQAFTAVLDGLGVDAGHTIMIGDSWERDIQGALSVGMRAVWIGADEVVPDDQRVPKVASLAGLQPGATLTAQ